MEHYPRTEILEWLRCYHKQCGCSEEELLDEALLAFGEPPSPQNVAWLHNRVKEVVCR